MKKFICILLIPIIIIVSTVFAFSEVKGDINGDGKVNSSDALLILQYAVGMDLPNLDTALADVNQDSKINAADALIVLQIAVGIISPEEDTTDPLKFDKSQLIKYYNSCLDNSYNYKVYATKTEQVDIAVSGVDIGSSAISTDKIISSIIANNTKNNGVVQSKTFINGVSTDDSTLIEEFVVPTNLYAEAVKNINIRSTSQGYQMTITLNPESCEYNEKAEYNASCTWPLDFSVIDFGVALTIKECTLNYPGTVFTVTIDSENRVSGVKTEMPLTIRDATASAVGINIAVGSIDGKWTCTNTMAFEKISGGSSGGSSSGSSGGSSSSNAPTTSTTKSFQQQLDEIKDRWGDVIKPTVDADGNITVESVDGSDTGLFGFKYSTKDKCFITAENAWQRNFGYNETYDVSSPVIAITYDTIRVYFESDGLEWMIQYWKGQYGMVLIGAEIGVYNRPAGSTASTHFECADDETKLLQSMDVYRRDSATQKYNKIFSRTPSFTWWCTGFIPGTLAAGQYNVEAEATRVLKVDSKITLKSPEMAQAFMEGLKQVDHIYHNAPMQKPVFSFTEMSSVAEYEASSKNGKFVLEEDGVTVRVCWR